jgi:hypothetical protein
MCEQAFWFLEPVKIDNVGIKWKINFVLRIFAFWATYGEPVDGGGGWEIIAFFYLV